MAAEDVRQELYQGRHDMAHGVAHLNEQGWRVQIVTSLPEATYRVVFVKVKLYLPETLPA